MVNIMKIDEKVVDRLSSLIQIGGEIIKTEYGHKVEFNDEYLWTAGVK